MLPSEERPLAAGDTPSRTAAAERDTSSRPVRARGITRASHCRPQRQEALAS